MTFFKRCNLCWIFVYTWFTWLLNDSLPSVTIPRYLSLSALCTCCTSICICRQSPLPIPFHRVLSQRPSSAFLTFISRKLKSNQSSSSPFIEKFISSDEHDLTVPFCGALRPTLCGLSFKSDDIYKTRLVLTSRSSRRFTRRWIWTVLKALENTMNSNRT